MALIELAKVIADDPAASRRWAAEPLPLTDRLTAVLTSRFAALPQPAQAALLLAAVADGPDLGAAVHGSGPMPGPLAPAEHWAWSGSTVQGCSSPSPRPFSDLHSAPSLGGRRRTAELAAGLDDEPDRRAWHLAAAALDPDEQVASLLEATAAQARRRGGAAAAALAMERAAELSPALADQARRLVAAASAPFPPARGTGCKISPPRPGGHGGPGTADDRPSRRRLGADLVGAAHRRAVRAHLVAEQASRDLPAWPGTRSRRGYRRLPVWPAASRQAVSRTLDLLDRQDPPPPGRDRTLTSTR